MMGSAPMTVMIMPMAPDRKPLRSDCSVSPATIDKAQMKSAKYSQGPNSSANLARGTVAPIRKTAPSRPPMAEAHVPNQTARPGSPFFAIGNPSNVVAIADGVPGMPMRLALTSPPAEPPTYTPVIAASPASGSRPKVKGRTMMIVIVIVTPGSAPPTRPASVPAASGIKYCSFMTSTRLVSRGPNIRTPSGARGAAARSGSPRRSRR